jgi:hypothetical protein
LNNLRAVAPETGASLQAGAGIALPVGATLEDLMKRAFAVALLAAFVVTGCAARGVRIAELKDQPSKYDDKSVSFTGTVTKSWGIPVIGGFYNVDDGSGEITVVSQSGTPRSGTRVQVKGKVHEFATFGSSSVGLHVREEDRKIRN